MGRLLWKWTRRVLATVGALFIVVYFGDWLIYKMRGSPQSHVRVNQTIVVPLKGAEIAEVVLLEKSGGRSGDWRRER